MIAEVVVVIPARDEQAGILACLGAVQTAADRARVTLGVRVQTVIVLDDCHDRTAELVAATPAVTAVVVGARCVGAARATGTAFALAAAGAPPADVWTAHTDADSRVPAHWLTSMVAVADAGADAVLGTVVPDGTLAPELRAAWAARHALEEGHPFVHGANFGVRGSTYERVGGFRALSVHEDVDLAARLERAGARIVRTAAATVTTSARRVGRAPLGFAHYLEELTAVERSA